MKHEYDNGRFLKFDIKMEFPIISHDSLNLASKIAGTEKF